MEENEVAYHKAADDFSVWHTNKENFTILHTLTVKCKSSPTQIHSNGTIIEGKKVNVKKSQWVLLHFSSQL